MSLGNDFESDEDNSKNRFQYLSKGVVNTLRNPLKISTLPRKLDFELRFAKLKADTKIQSGLDEIFGYQIDKFSAVKSVFETASFFTQILNSCQEKLTSVNLDDNGGTTEDVASGSEGSIRRHDSSPVVGPLNEKPCSIQHGHTDLPSEVNADLPKYLILGHRNKHSDVLSDYECEFYLRTEESKFTSILTPPIARCNHKTIDVSKFLVFRPLCKRCSLSKRSYSPRTKIDLKISGDKQSRSLLKFGKVVELFQKEEELRINPDIKGLLLREHYDSQSLLSNEVLGFGGAFKRFVKKPQIKSINVRKRDTTSQKSLVDVPKLSRTKSKAPKKGNPAESGVAFTDLPAVKKSVSKYKSVDCHNIGVDYPPRSGNSGVTIPSGLEPVSPPIQVIEKVPKKKKTSISPPGKESDSKKNRKVYVFDEAAAVLLASKELKKKKKRRIKKRSKLSINLSPPPGQNLDDYLQQQLLIIKAQLAAKKSVDSSMLEVEELTKSLKPAQPRKEDPKALPLEYEQVNYILGDLRPADGIGEIVVYNEEALLKSPKNDTDLLPLSKSPFSPEKYAYPSLDKRNKLTSNNPVFVSPVETNSDRRHRDDSLNERSYSRYRKSKSPNPRSNPPHRDRSHTTQGGSPTTERRRRAYSPRGSKNMPGSSRSPVSERKGRKLSPRNSRSKPRSSKSPRPRVNQDLTKKSDRSSDKSRREGIISKRKYSRESVRNQNGVAETHKISFTIKKTQEKTKLPNEPLAPGISTDDADFIEKSEISKRSSKQDVKIKEVGTSIAEEVPDETGVVVVEQSNPIIEIPSSPDDTSRALVLANKNSDSIIDEDELLTISEDSSKEGNKSRNINGLSRIKKRRRSFRRSRSRSLSVSPPGDSRRSIRLSRSRSRSYSPRRKRTYKPRGSRAPSPRDPNKKYSYSTKVVEVKQTIGTSVGASSNSGAVQQLQTTTVYEYQSTAGAMYPQPVGPPQAYPLMNYQYPHPSYPYYPQHPPMVPYHPAYNHPPYF